MSAQSEYPESYSIFDQLGTPQIAAPVKPTEFPESYSIFDTLAQPSQTEPESLQLIDQVASQGIPSQEIPTQDAALRSLETLTPEQPGEGILDRFGRALKMQAQMLYQPEAIPQVGAGALEGLTLGAVDVAEPKTGGGEIFREAGRIGGLTGPIKLIHRLFRPLGLWGRLAGAATSGAAIEAGKEYFKEGELNPEEILKEAAIWTGLEGSLLLAQSVSFISKASGKKPTEVMKFLWEKVKNKVKNPFKTQPTEQEVLSGNVDLNPEVEEVFVKEAQKEAQSLEKQGLKPQEQAKPGQPIILSHKPSKIEPEAPKAEIEAEVPEVAEKQPLAAVEKPIEPSKVPTLKEVQEATKSIYGEKPTSNAVSEKVHDVIQNGNYDPILHPNLKQPREIFQKLTGVTLPETLEGTKSALSEYKSRLKATPPSIDIAGPSVVSKKSIRPPSPKLSPRQPVIGKKQAAKRSDIINLFRKVFNDPIRLRKFKQRAQGIHKLWPKVTRLLKDNDVETAAHEIGHNLHTTLYGGDAANSSEQRNNINKALAPYLGELKPLAQYEPFGMEGFAEFTRLYVTNPDVAKEMAPKFYEKFENDLDAQYPELKNALLEARDYYDQYLHGTPQSRIRSQTDYGTDSSMLDNMIDWVKKFGDLDFLKTQFLDDVFAAKRLVAEAFDIPLSDVENLKDSRNLYRSLRVLKGAIGKADVFLIHETFDPKTLEKTGEGLRSILKQLPTEEAYKEFNDYLIARRSIEKAAQRVETGINLGDAIAVEKQLKDKYEKLARQLDEYNDSLLKYAKDGGLLSGQQYQQIKKNNLMYAPFQRSIEPQKGGKASAAGNLQAGKPIKRMKGSTRNIIAPIESVIKNTYSVIVNAEKNLSGQVLAELAKLKNVGPYVERVPVSTTLKAKLTNEEIEKATVKHLVETGQFDLLEQTDKGFALREDLKDIMPDLIMKFGPTSYPAGENIITVYLDGKPTYYEVSPELNEMWTKGIAPYTADLLTKILRIPARSLRAGAILNPKFIQKNFIRDTWGGFLFTKYGKEIKDPVGLFIDTLYSPLAMLGQAAGKGKLYVEWLKSGGGMSTMQSLDRQSVVKKLEEIRKGLKPTQVIQWLRKVAEISEEGNRLAEFARALEVEGKTRLGKEIAAFASRDLSIDFAKMGLQTKALNQIIPFFNATIQGGDKLVRTLASDEDRNEFLARVLGFVVIPSLMLAWLNQDDERVKEFQEQEKDFNFITFIGGTALKIPVPFETGVIAHGLTQRLYNFFMQKDPNAFEGFMGSIASAMLPNFIPSFANPVFETVANRNFFTGTRIVPASKEGLVAKYQYKNNSSTTARLLGRAMAYMLGQETRSKAASPAVIDHFINSWTGGLGRLMVSISDASLEAAGLGDKIPKPSQAITERFGLDAFIARYPRANTKSIEKFYDYYQDATARQKSLKYAQKMNLESDEAQEGAYSRFEHLYHYPSMQAAYRALQKSQREINNIWKDPNIPSDIKKTMIDDLYHQQIEFTREANKDIERYRKENK